MAQVSWNRQLGLAAGLFVLGTVAYWLEYKHKPAKEASEEQSKKLFQVKDNPIKSITLSDGTKTIVLTCSDLGAKLCKPGDNSKWEITEPIKLRADDANVNSLVSTLNTLTSNETINLKDETAEKRSALIKEYGLDASARKSSKRIEVDTQSGKTILYLGQAHPIGETIYGVEEKLGADQKSTGQVDDTNVYQVPTFFKANLEHELTHWRNKKLLPIAAHEVEAFKLDSPKGKLSGERKEGQWILYSGSEELTGDTENIDNLLSSTTLLMAKDFASDNKTDSKAKAALKGLSPILTMTLQKEKGSAKEAPAPMTLTIFQKKPAQPNGKVYATVSELDPLFELDPTAIDRLNKGIKDLRMTKLITSSERFGAKRLEFAGTPMGPSPLTLVNKDGKWLNDGTKAEVTQDKVHAILDKLSGNKITDFIVGSAIPAGEKDGLKLNVGDEKNNTKRQFVFWKVKDKFYARDLQSKRNEAFLVDQAVAEVLPWNQDFFTKTDSKDTAKSGTEKK